MILAVCPNLAMDVTYRVGEFTPGQSVRVGRVSARAGGKGTNVARVATALAAPNLLVGFAGGSAGTELVADLDAAAVRHEVVAVDGETRRTVAVVSPTETTVFLEPGPSVTGDDWDRLVELVRLRSTEAAVVTLSGSLPTGSPPDGYARLVAASGAPVVLDTSGPQLLRALEHRPAVVKPNHEEAGEMLRRPVLTTMDALAACEEFVGLGAGACVITMGADGLVALRDGRALRVFAGAAVSGNPTGAGDAFTATLATGLMRGDHWADTLRRGAAVAGAAVASEIAGDFDRELYPRLLEQTTIEELR